MGRNPLYGTTLAKSQKKFWKSSEDTIWEPFDVLVRQVWDKDKALRLYKQYWDGKKHLKDELYKAWLPIVGVFVPSPDSFRGKRMDVDELRQRMAIGLMRLLYNKKTKPDISDAAYLFAGVKFLSKGIFSLHRKDSRFDVPPYEQAWNRSESIVTHEDVEVNDFLSNILDSLPNRVAARSRFSSKLRRIVKYVVKEFTDFKTVSSPALIEKYQITEWLAKFMIEHSLILCRQELREIRNKQKHIFQREWRWKEAFGFFEELECREDY